MECIVMTDDKEAKRQLESLSGKAVITDNTARARKKSIMSWHDAAVVKQLKEIALDEDKTQQALISEALNLLFAKRGRRTIA